MNDTPQEFIPDDQVETDQVDADQVDADEAPEADEPPAPQYDPEDVDEARLFGWKTPDEWQGEKPAGYIDNPQDFLARVQKSRIFKAMNDKVQQTSQEAAETARKLEAANERALARQRQQHEDKIASLRFQRDRAAEDGDVDGYKTFAKQADELATQAPQEAPKQSHQVPPETPPEVVAYREANEWAKNPALWQEAAQAVNYMPGLTPQTPAKDQLEFAEQVMRQKYPHLFQQQTPEPKPKPRNVVDGGGLGGGSASSLGAFGKLPQVAKDTFLRQMREGIFADTKKDREEFANEYNAS